MSDIFAEVDEVMKQERLEKIWAEYKWIIITLIVGTILLTAVVSAYKSWDISVKEKQTVVLGSVLEAEDFPANVDLKSLDLHGDLRAMALMSAGARLLTAEKPDTDQALVYYKDVAADKKVSDQFRELASLMTARLSGGDAAAAEAALQVVYRNEESLWRYHAATELAVLSAHEAGDFAAAREYLAVVLAQKVIPAGLIARARSLDHIYAIRQSQKQSQK